MTATVQTPQAHANGRRASWSECNQQWLVAAIGRLRARIESGPRDGSLAPPPVEDCIVGHTVPNFTPALLHCAQLFGLSAFERELLLLVAGVELDQGLRTALADLTGSTMATFAAALGLLTQPHWDALSPDAPVRHWHLVEPERGPRVAQAALCIDERVLHYLTGTTASDAQLMGVASHLAGSEPEDDLLDAELAQRIVQALAADDERGTVAVLHTSAPDAANVRDLALAVVARLGRSALWIAARSLPTDPAELSMIARHVDREAALTGAMPVLALDAADEPGGAALVGQLRSDVLWLGQPAAALMALPERRRVLHFLAEPPSGVDRSGTLVARWRRSTAQGADDPQVFAALERAAAQFHHSPAALDDVVTRLEAESPATRCAAVWPIARAAARGGLDALAQRTTSTVGFHDLVLPAAQLEALRDITRHLQHRERVYRDWGFGRKHARGQGLTALFAGESGTGKTLAAEIIAREAGLDLYRVDLATVVSKYIGETEKNLKRLFDAAEASGAVLLFDEADALYGKRSDVKDSHDRYANIEVAYLLQRVEAYRGLAILTTNMKSALDRAFLRRIRFVVHFPFPDHAAREQIWRREFPASAPLGDIDFAALSRLHVAGGNIHTIALNAAFKAAEAGGRIEQSMLAAAARAEFAKLERSFTELAGQGVA